MKTDNKYFSDTSSLTTGACYHCGLPCEETSVSHADKQFCCSGCKIAFEILSENDLCQYYRLNDTPGLAPGESQSDQRFAYLDDETVLTKVIQFRNDTLSKATLFIPQIHCSSCIWLLENLQRLNDGVLSVKVDFLRKEAFITWDHAKTSLREIVALLSAIGYEPQISLESLDSKKSENSNKDLYIKIGISGFCFGNIMLLSLPEYFDFGHTLSPAFQQFFRYLNILLSLPVLFYGASGYLKSAYKALKRRAVNIDVPLSIGIITLFSRSLYEIIGGSGAGYMDSFAGLIFLLLIGKIFQKKTYDTLSFERDYKSFFPVSVTRRDENGETSIPLSKLAVGDRIIVRNQELIPADAILRGGNGYIDYSFVTGETDAQARTPGDHIFAGGRQDGGAIELEIIKEVSQSYLTRLWNNDAFKAIQDSPLTNFANTISKYFTAAILLIAFAAFFYWYPQDVALAINAFTAVLIIACPCALALSTPFTLGSVMRIFGKAGLYLKNTQVIEILAKIDRIVFDKTGTLTRPQQSRLNFVSLNGLPELTEGYKSFVKTLAKQSTHPLSQALYHHLGSAECEIIEAFEETAGRGISGAVEGHIVKLGSRSFIDLQDGHQNGAAAAPEVFVSIDGTPKGYFQIHNPFRRGLEKMMAILRKTYQLTLLSGDIDRERQHLQPLFGSGADLKFQQSPQEKLDYIKDRQSAGEMVMMIGDGLNDAGALKQSNAGITVTENLNSFSPACDAILDAGSFSRLTGFLKFSGTAMTIIKLNFVISLLYNLVGLSFAVTGMLSPLICAILMPLSSISVIAFATSATTLLARRQGFIAGNPAPATTAFNNGGISK